MNSQASAASDIYNNGYYRGLAARLEYAAGFDVPLEISWPTFNDADADSLDDILLKVYFEPLIKAFQSIKITGPDDLEWKLKRVVVQSQTFKGAHFSNGILIVDFPLNSDPDAIEARAEIIAKALRK